MSDKPPYPTEKHAGIVRLDQVEKAYAAVGSFCEWNVSAEGGEYWADVYMRLGKYLTLRRAYHASNKITPAKAVAEAVIGYVPVPAYVPCLNCRLPVLPGSLCSCGIKQPKEEEDE